jgi:hypothetical protein
LDQDYLIQEFMQVVVEVVDLHLNQDQQDQVDQAEVEQDQHQDQQLLQEQLIQVVAVEVVVDQEDQVVQVVREL